MIEFAQITLPPLLTLAEAKVHLHLTGTDYDADVQQKLDEAQDAVIRQMNVGANQTWTPATVPPYVKSAIKLLLTHLYMERGDGDTKDPWPAIHNLLALGRDVTVA